MTIYRYLISDGQLRILTNKVCPAIAVFLSNINHFSPLISLKEAVSRGDFGQLNPIPFVTLVGKTFGWTAYGFLKRDVFIVLANAPGLYLSIWLNAGVIKLQYLASHQVNKIEDQKQSNDLVDNTLHTINEYDLSSISLVEEYKPSSEIMAASEVTERLNVEFIRREKVIKLPVISRQEIFLNIQVLVWFIVIIVLNLISFTQDQKEDIVGTLVNINMILFYGSPLSTIVMVIKDRDSSSIDKPLLITNILNAIIWCIYGAIKCDYFIFCPNAVGFSLGLIQAIIYIIYRPRQS